MCMIYYVRSLDIPQTVTTSFFTQKTRTRTNIVTEQATMHANLDKIAQDSNKADAMICYLEII
jgi:hypothetical protein